MLRWRTAVFVALIALAWSAHAHAAVRSSFSAPPTMLPSGHGTLRVESDAADPILLACIGDRVLVNGAHPDTGPLPCSLANRIEVRGGPGDNRIDLGGFAPAQLPELKGVSAYASIDAGPGDDVVIGPTGGLVTLVGGPGSDHLSGGAFDTYVFGAADSPERDTIVEPATDRCDPTYSQTDRLGVSYWTVPWDALDFRSLGADDPVTVEQPAREGVLAVHRNRTVTVTGTDFGTRFEAIAGGAGADRIGRACMVRGEDGDDVLSGGPDGDLLIGGLGDDRLVGGDGPDELDGNVGADAIDGGQGADALAGGPGDDVLHGGQGGDTYRFEAREGVQSDRVGEAAGSGVDVLSFDVAVPVQADLTAGRLARAGGSTVRAENGTARFFEGVIGGTGDDRMSGNAAANHFWSGGGNDLAEGKGGNDVYHADWSGSMPDAAYDWAGDWFGPFDRGVQSGRSYFTVLETRRSVLRLLERARDGFDTVDLSSRWEGQLRGIRADLSRPLRIAEHPRVAVRSARRFGPRHLEGLRGTEGPDVLVGNAAANRLDGNVGRDTCVAQRKLDRVRNCERVRRV